MDIGADSSTISIIYDGECPVCSRYVTHMRLRENFSTVKLVDAREDKDLVADYRRRGMNLDNGMVVVLDSKEYFGADAVNALALLSSESGIFNRLNALIFRNASVAKLLYPLMRTGRRILLTLLGRSKIN